MGDALVTIGCGSCGTELAAQHRGPHVLDAWCTPCGVLSEEHAPTTYRPLPPSPHLALATPLAPALQLASEGCRALAPGESATALRVLAARWWVDTVTAAGPRLGGDATVAQLLAYPAVVAWWGTHAAELALPAPW